MREEMGSILVSCDKQEQQDKGEKSHSEPSEQKIESKCLELWKSRLRDIMTRTDEVNLSIVALALPGYNVALF